MTSLWRRRSIATFFAVGFGLPWLGWTINAVTTLDPPVRTMLFYFGDFMTIAGLVAVFSAGGIGSLRSMLGRCLRSGPAIWWAFALFLPLVWVLAGRIAYGLRHGGVGTFDPSGFAGYLAPGAWLAWTTGPLGEEAGWRGYFLPRLLGRLQTLTASLILGLIWAIWHVPLYIHSNFSTVGRGLNFTTSVVCLTILMTILFHRTRGSLLLAVLFHWSVNVTPDVAEKLLPGVDHSTGFQEGYSLVALIIVTLVAAGVAGWRRLAAGDDFVVGRDLAGEAVDR
jgi:membrane protease YdiL (CAAX protease family)